MVCQSRRKCEDVEFDLLRWFELRGARYEGDGSAAVTSVAGI